ncbi:Ada metal-binding domain-containing protein [Candidatus Lokiarchaeum ossiferum]|uniref:Ada metal-binding domain-containing protein n=1 Tax=Candidatus Lokiarchaeum ossiferum TaxID=2951803 RepID=UPI00352BFF5B
MNYSFDFMYTAIKNKNMEYDGVFFTCVKSTGIFCLPSCKAKTPFSKNVEFVSTASEAKEKGYRPCKRCYPMNGPHFYPKWLEKIETYLANNLNRVVLDLELSNIVNLEISTIRRHFKNKHTLSLKEYHRNLRLEKARKLMQEGKTMKEIHPLVGYQSVKGLKLAYTKHLGIM